MSRTFPTCFGIAAVVLLAACGISEPKELRVLGRIDQSASQPRVVVPGSVVAGESFVVTVVTTIRGCQRAGDTESSVEGTTATVTPFDVEFIQRPGVICDNALLDAEHEATVVFSSTGPALVVIRARDLASDEEIELQFPVVVQ